MKHKNDETLEEIEARIAKLRREGLQEIENSIHEHGWHWDKELIVDGQEITGAIVESDPEPEPEKRKGWFHF